MIKARGYTRIHIFVCIHSKIVDFVLFIGSIKITLSLSNENKHFN